VAAAFDAGAEAILDLAQRGPRACEREVYRQVAAETAGATLRVCAYIDQQKKENLDSGAFRIKSD
jgi:hypothetical protein